MHFAFTEEQEEFRRNARRFLDKHAPTESVRRVMESERGWDPELWSRVCGELGWAALTIPEEYGGFGFGMVEHVALMEEAGRALFCSPLLASVSLASNLLLACGDIAACERWLPGIASGELRATAACSGSRGGWGADAVSVVASSDGGGWRLDGEAHHVLDGHSAELLLVVARLPDARLGLFAIEGEQSGLTRTLVPTMDQTRRKGTLRFESVALASEARVGATFDVGFALETALRRAGVALAAEQVGGAQRCLDDAVEYAKVREQFGRPIGSFQAIKHMCADMMVLVESARSAAWYAAWAADAGTAPAFVDAAACAKTYSSDAYFACAGQNIQIHGGVGFTWEYDAHLHFKRASAGKRLFGTPDAHREAIARTLLD